METISLTVKFTKASGRKGMEAACVIPAKKPDFVPELQSSLWCPGSEGSLVSHKMTSCHIVPLEKLNKIMCLKWQEKHLTHTCAINMGSPLLPVPMQTGETVKVNSLT